MSLVLSHPPPVNDERVEEISNQPVTAFGENAPGVRALWSADEDAGFVAIGVSSGTP